MVRVLWIAPNPNFYKLRFLERLAARGVLDITVLCGDVRDSEGHPAFDPSSQLKRIDLPVDKSRFALSVGVYRIFMSQIRTGAYDVVLLPTEKKHIPLILFAYIMRWVFRFRLLSYAHPTLRSSKGITTGWNRFLSRVLYMIYDGVVFYTEQSYRWAVASALISDRKASFANNTIDTESVREAYSFSVNETEPKRLLFIGRLVPSKRLDMLFQCFGIAQSWLPGIQLDIIGDGPLASEVTSQVESNRAIHWHGAISDEAKIATHMSRAHLVIVPGHSGLSIVHAFCYGKPYVTMADSVSEHPPEISYLEDGKNGMLLSRTPSMNVARMLKLLASRREYAAMCRSAYSTADRLDVRRWCEQIETALLRLGVAK